jgi:hypothetical protein
MQVANSFIRLCDANVNLCGWLEHFFLERAGELCIFISRGSIVVIQLMSVRIYCEQSNSSQ